jgi:hypothetical protein
VNAPFVPGRHKARFADVPQSRASTTLTDREVLRAIAENADLLNAERIAGGLWLLTPITPELVEYLATVGAEDEDSEPDQDEGGTEEGADPDLEPDDEDTDIEDQVFDPITNIIGARDTVTCEDFEPSPLDFHGYPWPEPSARDRKQARKVEIFLKRHRGRK